MPDPRFLSHLRNALNGRRAGEADIWTNFQVVQPLDPRGLTVVRSECNEQPIVVGNVSGLTFAPGASVMIGTNTNRPGKAIIAGAPPGRMGASLVPQEFVSRSYGTAPAPVETCPSSLTGRSYLAVVDENKVGGGGGPETLWSYIYTDGAYVSTVASYDYSGDGITLPSDPTFQRLDDDTILFSASGLGADLLVCVWDTDANTLAIAECTHPDFVNTGCAAMWDQGSFAYFFMEYGFSNPRSLQMYRVSIGATGAWNEVTARVGTTFATHSGTGHAPSENILGLGGAAFLVPTLNYGEDPEVETALVFSAGAWAAVPAWHSYANDGSMGNGSDGFPISGGRGLRSTFGPASEPILGASSASAAEESLLPLDWQPTGGFTNLHASPSGAEFVVLVDPTGFGFDQFLRLPVSGVGALGECPIPGITIEESPDGFVPGHLLPRDH